MQHEEPHTIVVQHRPQRAADRGLLTHHKKPPRLIGPPVLTVTLLHHLYESVRVTPTGKTLDLARLVNDPFPRDQAELAGFRQRPRHLVSLALAHVGDQL